MNVSYHEPATWQEAHALLERHGDDATVLAGGTAFTLLLRQGLIRPGHVVALRRIAGASAIDADAHGGVSIGALATHTAVQRSDRITAAWPELADAVAKVATVRVRNQATLGGSVAHADPASDAPVMLCALAAQVVVTTADAGSRRVPIEELFVDTFTTTLGPAELIRSIEIPARPAGAAAVYRKYTLRSADDYACVSVGALADLGGGVFGGLRLFLGGVGPTPMRARSVERALAGTRVDARAIADAAALARDDVDPQSDTRGSAAYKREMARVWTERALRALAGMPIS
ncbi:MAG TPA: xanthine dehydrogenase family protein subunit M [Candidatus Limnocylindria bacterium]|nr:xanthine dehydrogenase family protein subunit M [Candidatus Limnocylindria bacterium]